MELTLEQALQKGIKAHKAGQVQEADRYYSAILKTLPKHPETNFNMGMLCETIGKKNEALIFFKNAVEEKPNVSQFWITYINQLISLNHLYPI